MNQRPSLVWLVYGILLPASLLALAWAAGSLREAPIQRSTRLLMGTVVEVTVAGCEDATKANEAIDAAFAEIARIEDKFSAFKETSVVRRINSLRAGEALDIDDETLYVIDAAIAYHKMTEGAFDITVKPLVDLWGFSTHRNVVPATDQIAAALRTVGAENIVLDRVAKRLGFLKDGVRIDLGGIAKGYASDRAIEILKAHGIRNAIVNSGGDMYCLGRRAPGRLWKVGIQHPRVRGRLIGELSIENAAVDTSGDYEKFFQVGGKRFCHIIDPKTGMPAGSDPSSVTVIAPSAMEADALATACMVLGQERARKVMERFKGVEWLMTRESGAKVSVFKSGDIGRLYEEKQ
jgi:thiamine biosynthesis lipoprotein